MSDIKKLLETMNRMSVTEKKSTGPKFPGYWKGTDPAGKAKDKMVGSAEESIIKDLNKVSKEKVIEWKLTEEYKRFKEQTQPYTGIDPIVRQRLGMPPASLDDVVDYTVNNPPYIRTGDGTPLKTNDGKPVLSGGEFDILKDVNPTWAREFERPQKDISSTTQVSPAITRTGEPAVSPTTSISTSPATAPSSSVSTSTSSTAPAAPAAVTTPVAPRNNTSAAALPTASAAVAPQPVVPAPVRAPYRGSSSAREIQAVNPSIRDVNKIQAGQRLKLPDSDEDYVVQKGDTLDKIGKMYRSGEIGGRVVGGDGPTPTPAARPPAPASTTAPAAGTSSSSTAPSTPAASGPRNRPPAVPPRAVPPTSFDRPGPDTDTSDRPATATRPQSAAPSSTVNPAPAASNPTVKLGFGDPGYTPIIGNKLEKRSDGKWYYSIYGNNTPVRRADVIKHAETQLAKQRSTTTPSPGPQPAAPASRSVAPESRPSGASSAVNSSDAMASYATKGGRVYAADFNNPSGLGWDGKGKYTSYKTPEEGVNATRDLVARYLTDRTPYIKGPATPEQVVSTWVTGGKTPADKIQGGRYLQSVKDELAAAGVKLDSKGRIPHSQAATDAITRAIVRHETSPKHMEKFAPFLNAPKDAKGSIEESNKEDEKIAGRYDPDEFDLMVKRLGQKAREQDRKHGPVDIARLAKRLKDIERREQTKEQEDPAINMQDPDVQRTSQTSPQQDSAAVKQQQLDQTVDLATAKGTMSGLKTALGPKVDTNALASAVTKISDQKPLTGPESTAMSALTPLISKAAETPQTAMALKTALSNAGMLAKQGK
jgi:hypothetical protein